MIPEKEREAIMRLTMCARRNCAICIYGHNRKRATVKLPQSCLDRITENMNILAAACDDKNEPKRGEWIVTTETSDDGAVSQHINCSVCGFYWREPKHRKVFKRCPHCGAKLEARE